MYNNDDDDDFEDLPVTLRGKSPGKYRVKPTSNLQASSPKLSPAKPATKSAKLAMEPQAPLKKSLANLVCCVERVELC